MPVKCDTKLYSKFEGIDSNLIRAVNLEIILGEHLVVQPEQIWQSDQQFLRSHTVSYCQNN